MYSNCRAFVQTEAQILKKGAGLLQGSRSSVVRESVAKIGSIGFDY